MKRLALFLCMCTCAFTACQPRPSSQQILLKTYPFQSDVFYSKDHIGLQHALIKTLQEEGFTVTAPLNIEVDTIEASKKIRLKSPLGRSTHEVPMPSLQALCTIRPNVDWAQLHATFTLTTYDKDGNIATEEQLIDDGYYNHFFSLIRSKI
jgi:hypothetical protein